MTGRSAVPYGTKANFDFTTATATANWVGIVENVATTGVDIIGYNVTDATEVDTVIGANGETLAKGFIERKQQISCDIIGYASTKALAANISWPLALAVLTIINADNTLLNGSWNVVEGGGWTGESNSFLKGSITLERYSTSDFADNNMAALASIT